MYLLIFIYDVDVVCLFINESGIIKKNVNTKKVLRLKKLKENKIKLVEKY